MSGSCTQRSGLLLGQMTTGFIFVGGDDTGGGCLALISLMLCCSVVNYRRCFQDWKRFTARSKANGQRVEQLLHSSLKLCHRDRLRHYFSGR